jgi:mRNA-degrading endonuclease RelE of RelBE toxin-antitoxin system
MEPVSQEKVIFKVLFHTTCEKELDRLHPDQVTTILDAIKARLSSNPQFAGNPLRGCKNLVYKFRVGKCRIVYSILFKHKEVWILSIQTRDMVYRPEHLESLLRIAIAIHQHRSK